MSQKAPRGWEQNKWTAFRQHCQEIANKAASHIPLNDADWSDAASCGSAYDHDPYPPPKGYSPPIAQVAPPSPVPTSVPSPPFSEPSS